MSELVPGLDYRDFLVEAARHRTEDSFRASAFFARHGGALDALLLAPRIITPRLPGGGAGSQARVPVAAPGPLRVVQWNIEKGKQLAGLKQHLGADPVLGAADICCLNEVDAGMARSGPNADVAGELAAAAGCGAIHLPNYIECTRGLPGEAPPGGENELGLHGLAILTRLPVLDVRVEALPPAWDYFDYPEKRFGGRRGLYLRLDWAGGSIVAATAHLEMRTGPAGRARQFAAFLAGLERAEAAWGRGHPTVLTGDWNTHTFRRGGRLDPARGLWRMIGTRPARLDDALLNPLQAEPLFDHLARAGFDVEGVNDFAPTASQALDAVEDLGRLPGWLGRWILRAAGLRGRVLGLRLDWIAVRGFRPVSPPRTLPSGPDPSRPLSDHAPIMAELVPRASGVDAPPARSDRTGSPGRASGR